MFSRSWRPRGAAQCARLRSAPWLGQGGGGEGGGEKEGVRRLARDPSRGTAGLPCPRLFSLRGAASAVPLFARVGEGWGLNRSIEFLVPFLLPSPSRSPKLSAPAAQARSSAGFGPGSPPPCPGTLAGGIFSHLVGSRVACPIVAYYLLFGPKAFKWATSGHCAGPRLRSRRTGSAPAFDSALQVDS